MAVMPRPYRDALNEAVDVYRDALRPFIVRQLKEQRGVQPRDAIQRALRNDSFAINLHRNGSLESAIDVGDFPLIVNTNKGAFQQCYDASAGFLTKLWDAKEGRDAAAHPSTSDLDGEYVRTRISIIVEVLGIIRAEEEKSRVEALRERLFAPRPIATQPAPKAQAMFTGPSHPGADAANQPFSAEVVEQVKAIRKKATESWVNIYKGARNLQGLPHEPFGTPNVESTAKSCVRKINRECGLTLEEIEGLAQAYCG